MTTTEDYMGNGTKATSNITTTCARCGASRGHNGALASWRWDHAGRPVHDCAKGEPHPGDHPEPPNSTMVVTDDWRGRFAQSEALLDTYHRAALDRLAVVTDAIGDLMEGPDRVPEPVDERAERLATLRALQSERAWLADQVRLFGPSSSVGVGVSELALRSRILAMLDAYEASMIAGDGRGLYDDGSQQVISEVCAELHSLLEEVG